MWIQTEAFEKLSLEAIFHSWNLCVCETNSLSRPKSQKVVNAYWTKSPCYVLGQQLHSFMSVLFHGKQFEEPLYRLNLRENCSCGSGLCLCPQRTLKETEKGDKTAKLFCIHPPLWTVFFPHGRHSFFIIQTENDLTAWNWIYHTKLPTSVLFSTKTWQPSNVCTQIISH